eukprot:9545226-Alexandrium_andersonii.AAC.1
MRRLPRPCASFPRCSTVWLGRSLAIWASAAWPTLLRARLATNPHLQRARHDPAAQAENLRHREQQVERGEADA